MAAAWAAVVATGMAAATVDMQAAVRPVEASPAAVTVEAVMAVVALPAEGSREVV